MTHLTGELSTQGHRVVDGDGRVQARDQLVSDVFDYFDRLSVSEKETEVLNGRFAHLSGAILGFEP